jgi:hypothetical protein
VATNKTKPNDKKWWQAKFFKILFYLIIVALGIYLAYYLFIALPLYMVKFGKDNKFGIPTGVIGDTIAGTLGTVIAFIAAILTFLAFYIQYKANEQQKIDLQLERFENKFFELLKLHKENLSEMAIDGYDVSVTLKTSFTKSTGDEVLERTEEQVGRTITGRKIFVTVFNELKACYEICKDRLQFEEIDDMERYVIKMSYRLLFNGIGTNAVIGVDPSVKDDKQHVITCKLALKEARAKHVETNGKDNIISLRDRKNKWKFL